MTEMTERLDIAQESLGGLHSLALATRQTGATELKEIVVFIEGRRETAGVLKFAGALVKEHNAQLIGVFIQPEPEFTPTQTFALGPGSLRVIEEHRAQLERIERRERAQFEDVVRRHGIAQSKWRSLSHWSTEVAVPAYYADVVIIARPESGQMSHARGLAESLVLSSGRPIILVPPNAAPSRVRRILIGWNATRESVRAVVDALPLIVRTEAVEVLIVDYQKQRERHGQEPGAEVARRLTGFGAQVEVQRLSSGGQDVGHLLLAQADAFRADLLVMGAYGHSTLHEWLLGGVTRSVLYEAGLPVLMSR